MILVNVEGIIFIFWMQGWCQYQDDMTLDVILQLLLYEIDAIRSVNRAWYCENKDPDKYILDVIKGWLTFFSAAFNSLVDKNIR